MDKALDPVIEAPLVRPGESESAKGYAKRAEVAAEKAENAVNNALADFDFELRDDGHLWMSATTKEGEENEQTV